MATFNTPRTQPYNAFREIGTRNLKSKYIPNDYYIEFTPSWWRMAIDNAINYSDLTYVDTLYSWCVESSPFLVSQINKRLIPASKTSWAFELDGRIDPELTEMLTSPKWFRKLVRARLLSKFYGVKVVGIDVVTDTLVDYPMRNIDIVNQAIRQQTYGIEEVAPVKNYDNLFFMQPDTDQDFKMGMLQPISRAMIGIVEAYNNWSVTSATYSYPRTTVGYMEGNKEVKQRASEIANDLDPLSTPLLPFKQNLEGKENVYQIEINPVQTQMYPDAFRVFKEYIESYRSEIMQLVTGGTLLGATEKNTNSEQLASIHMGLYEDICDDDKRDIINFFNKEGVLQKLARLLDMPEIARAKMVEVPDTTITLDKFERVGKVLASQGIAFRPEVLSKVGLEPADVNTAVRNNNWGEAELQRKSILAKIKGALKPQRNANGNRTGEDAEEGPA